MHPELQSSLCVCPHSFHSQWFQWNSNVHANQLSLHHPSHPACRDSGEEFRPRLPAPPACCPQGVSPAGGLSTVLGSALHPIRSPLTSSLDGDQWLSTLVPTGITQRCLGSPEWFWFGRLGYGLRGVFKNVSRVFLKCNQNWGRQYQPVNVTCLGFLRSLWTGVCYQGSQLNHPTDTKAMSLFWRLKWDAERPKLKTGSRDLGHHLPWWLTLALHDSVKIRSLTWVTHLYSFQFHLPTYPNICLKLTQERPSDIRRQFSGPSVPTGQAQLHRLLCLTQALGFSTLVSLCPSQSSPGKGCPGTLLAGSRPHLTLIQRRVLGLLEDHAEGDTLGVGGEDPADGEACLGHGDGDEAVGTGPHEQLPAALAEVGDLFHREG